MLKNYVKYSIEINFKLIVLKNIMTTKGAAVPFQHLLHISNVHGGNFAAAAVVFGVLATGHSGRCFSAFGCCVACIRLC